MTTWTYSLFGKALEQSKRILRDDNRSLWITGDARVQKLEPVLDPHATPSLDVIGNAGNWSLTYSVSQGIEPAGIRMSAHHAPFRIPD